MNQSIIVVYFTSLVIIVELCICGVSVYGMFKENFERQLLLLFLCHFHFPFEDHFAVVARKTPKES